MGRKRKEEEEGRDVKLCKRRGYRIGEGMRRDGGGEEEAEEVEEEEGDCPPLSSDKSQVAD